MGLGFGGRSGGDEWLRVRYDYVYVVRAESFGVVERQREVMGMAFLRQRADNGFMVRWSSSRV